MKRLRDLPTFLYGIGCGLSQSLMSVGGTLFAVFGGLVSYRLIRQKSQHLFRGAAVLASLWIVFSIVNLLARGWESRTWESLRDLPLLWVPLAALSVHCISQRKSWNRVCVVAASAVTVSSLWACIQFLSTGAPAISFLRNPIYLAYNLLPAFVFFSEMFLSPPAFSTVHKAVWGGTALLCAAGIVSTVSRVPMTCLLAYAAFRAIPAMRAKTGARGAAVAVLLFLGLCFTAYRHVPAFEEKVNRAFSSQDPSRVWRLTAWKYNWNLFLDSPWVGTGTERNGIDVAVHPEFAGHWDPNRLYFAHSIYLQSLADSGLIGTLLFFGFWILLWGASVRIRPLLAIAALSGATENIFNNSKAAHALFFYAFLFLLTDRLEKSRDPA